MNFKDNLRTIRKLNKISQEDLAEKVGVSRQSISKWECGSSYPEMDNILKLCNIFHCKINDLIHVNSEEFESLDKEIKMSVVKLKKEEQRKMKGLSKAIYILSRIGKIFIIVGMVCVILAMIITLVLANTIRIENKNNIEILGEEVKYKRTNQKITIIYNNEKTVIKDSNEVHAMNLMLEKLENNSTVKLTIIIEVAFITLTISLILLYKTLKNLEQLFYNIHNGETPFTMENVSYIKKIAFLMIATIIIPNICGIITEMMIGEDLGIGFETFDIIYILFLFSMAYIFEYGYQIQLDSKGKMYGDENE